MYNIDEHTTCLFGYLYLGILSQKTFDNLKPPLKGGLIGQAWPKQNFATITFRKVYRISLIVVIFQ